MPDADGSHPDFDLVRRAAGGDRHAARSIVTRLAPSVQRGVLQVLMADRSSRSDRRRELEDLVQDTFVALFAHGGRELLRWDPDRGMKLESFVTLVARRLAISKRRSRWLETLGSRPSDAAADGPAPMAAPDEVFAAREDLHTLSARLRASLSPLGLVMFQRLFVLDQSVEVICHEMAMTGDAVYQWRKRLRDTLAEIREQLVAPPARASRGGDA